MLFKSVHPNYSLYRRIHCNSVVLSGVLNAADCYGLDELRAACTGFADTGGGITVDTACALLASAERYIHYKCTKSLVQKVRGGRVRGERLNHCWRFRVYFHNIIIINDLLLLLLLYFRKELT